MTVSSARRAVWDQERRRITDNIRSYGVHLTYVGGEASAACDCCPGGREPLGSDDSDPLAGVVEDLDELPDRLAVPFCYTTGLFGVGHPELVVLGLSPEPAANLLNVLAHRVLEHQGDLTPGELTEVDGLQVLVEELPNPGMVLFEANGYYDRPLVASVPAYQLTWSDAEGRYPWDEGHLPVPCLQPRPGHYRA
ncbi:DUF4262 domain-containing protein [Ornithinimicrobium pekingense]|uniref:DUF4262 domain-containing protein n=1 Tax=Ornithinimicrobium pekingense TaxID=384677 RepID=A0ABQ2FC56_9MICO|nr:DUF4262 domain-containing protein [Ornithinimicrobium pekingense]GGK73205.1 hypothetical protein GCM10011509_22280 [Ornithinimicrobium pekingense]